ncbi:MAG: glycosyltransferase family 4 protein [candidate division KSB1 bacterium]|nr:glycosyltransferase family 4 protein [candidate division KSB1 bacterium]MDZ7302955.1 glycosyltransferase family 4 protein [candidate division KSB1 bacterium]MDZ7312231.1 glycosyltransferase family 4 protein [candidate division KSB1 bacterium]
MKILILTSRVPYPPLGGDRLRLFNFAKSLAHRHHVTLLALTDNPAEVNVTIPSVERSEIIYLSRHRSYLNCLRGLFSKKPLQVHYYQSPAMRQRIQQLLQYEKFDLIFVHLFRMAEYVAGVNVVPKILDLTDALSLNYERSRALEKEHRLNLISLAQKVERRRVLRYETHVVNDFDLNLLISPVDRAFLNQFAPVENVEIIGPGVDLEYFEYYGGPYDERQIIFVGKMSTFPNKDAARYFCESIFPLVLKRFPDMSFVIVGIEPPPEILALDRHPHVKILGRVPDVRPYLHHSVVSVCPMRTGAGAKNKVLESLAAGTPVVATSLGIEGLQLQPGRDVLVADTPETFAAHVARVVEDRNLRMLLSEHGRRRMEEHYSWEAVLTKLHQLVEAVTQKSAKPYNSMSRQVHA